MDKSDIESNNIASIPSEVSERSERVRYFQHEKKNFVSPSGHVKFYLLYKH